MMMIGFEIVIEFEMMIEIETMIEFETMIETMIALLLIDLMTEIEFSNPNLFAL